MIVYGDHTGVAYLLWVKLFDSQILLLSTLVSYCIVAVVAAAALEYKKTMTNREKATMTNEIGRHQRELTTRVSLYRMAQNPGRWPP